MTDLAHPPFRLQTDARRAGDPADVEVIRDADRLLKMSRAPVFSQLRLLQSWEGRKGEEELHVHVLRVLKRKRTWKDRHHHPAAHILHRALQIGAERGELWTPALEVLSAMGLWPTAGEWEQFLSYSQPYAYATHQEGRDRYPTERTRAGRVGAWFEQTGDREALDRVLDSHSYALQASVSERFPLRSEADLDLFFAEREDAHPCVSALARNPTFHEGLVDAYLARVRALLSDPHRPSRVSRGLQALDMLTSPHCGDRAHELDATTREALFDLVPFDDREREDARTSTATEAFTRSGEDHQAFVLLLKRDDLLDEDFLHRLYERVPKSTPHLKPLLGCANAGPRLWRAALEHRQAATGTRDGVEDAAFVAHDNVRADPVVRQALIATSTSADVLEHLLHDLEPDYPDVLVRLLEVDRGRGLAWLEEEVSDRDWEAVVGPEGLVRLLAHTRGISHEAVLRAAENV